METTTTQCSAFNHPEFSLVVEQSIPREDVDWLVLTLEQSVRDGTRYEAGDLIRVGSMLVQTELRGSCLFLKEPDLCRMPIFWVDGVTHALQILRLQKDTAESLGLGAKIAFPNIRDSLLVGTDIDANDQSLVLERATLSGSDSGWFIGRDNTHLDYTCPDNLRRVSVYEGYVNWPRISRFMALPEKTRIELSNAGIAGSCDGKALIVREGSFLDKATT